MHAAAPAVAVLGLAVIYDSPTFPALAAFSAKTAAYVAATPPVPSAAALPHGLPQQASLVARVALGARASCWVGAAKPLWRLLRASFETHLQGTPGHPTN